jgi:hypothetical protein
MHTFVSVCVNSNFGVNISILPENQSIFKHTALHITYIKLKLRNHVTNNAISTYKYEMYGKYSACHTSKLFSFLLLVFFPITYL